MSRRKVTRGSPPRIARSRNRTWPKGGTESARRGKRARKKGDEDPTNFLGVYFREMSDIGVMTPEEELASAVRIVRARQSHWEAILAYPPFIDAIVAVIEAKIDAEDVPTFELKQIRKTSRELRDRETKNHKQAFEAAKDALSEKMRDLDVDGIVSEIVVGDIAKITVGDREDLSLAVNFPRQGSRPFKAYSDSVASTAAALTHAKNRFVKANLRLVVSIARRFNHGRMPLQDLIQEGNLGLLKAVDRFDYRKGFRFSTYGSWWIRHAISRAIADKGRAVRLPVHMIDAQHKLTKAKRELEMVNGREPTTQELSGKTGLTTVKIEKMQGLLLDQAISLDRPVSKDDGRRIVDFLEDEDAEIPGEALEISSLNEQVRQCIMALRPIEADILRKRFGLGEDNEQTLKQIGEQYSLSRERIRQLQEQALGKIRRELKRREAV